MLLWPDSFLLLNGRFEEMVGGFWSRCCELIGFPFLGNEAKVVVDFAYYACLFPGFAFRGFLRRWFVSLPAPFWKDPAAAAGGLDEEHVKLVGREGDHAGDQSLSLSAVP